MKRKRTETLVRRQLRWLQRQPLRRPRRRRRRLPPLLLLSMLQRLHQRLRLRLPQQLARRVGPMQPRQVLQQLQPQLQHLGAASRCRLFSLLPPPSRLPSTGSAKRRRWWRRSELRPLQPGLMRMTMTMRKKSITTSSTWVPSAVQRLLLLLQRLLLLALQLVQPHATPRLHPLPRSPVQAARPPKLMALVQLAQAVALRQLMARMLLRLVAVQGRWPSSKRAQRRQQPQRGRRSSRTATCLTTTRCSSSRPSLPPPPLPTWRALVVAPWALWAWAWAWGLSASARASVASQEWACRS